MKHELTVEYSSKEYCGDAYCTGHTSGVIKCSACGYEQKEQYPPDRKELRLREIEHRLDVAGV